MIGIYKIENLLNHKIYIGQSNDIQRRFYEHKARYHDINSNCYHKPLYCAFRKYGLENFSFEIIEECDLAIINEKEKYWITYYNSVSPYGYNILESTQGVNRKKKKYYCNQCGVEISKDSNSRLCRSCYSKTTRKVDRPSKEELYNYLLSIKGNFSEAGRHFKVSDNSIRKWCKTYNIPSSSKEYK